MIENGTVITLRVVGLRDGWPPKPMVQLARADGETVAVPREFVEKAVPPPKALCLTRRQREVLAMLCEGRSNPEIDELLELEAGSAAKYVNRMRVVLGIKSIGDRGRAKLIERARSL